MTEILEGYRKRDPETGLIFPWYTWPCLEWLSKLDLKRKRVFEYGLGDSTIWYRAKGCESFGVDNNINWCLHAGNGYWNETTRICYINTINRYGYFDLVVIDGDYRDDCTEYALKYMKPGGHLIIDNYRQPSVEPNIWTQTDKLIEGMPITIYKQPGHQDWATAVITKI